MSILTLFGVMDWVFEVPTPLTSLDALSSATKKKPKSKGGGSGGGGSNKPEPPPEPEEGVARFVDWRIGNDRGRPVLGLTVAAGANRTKYILVVPNKSDKDSGLNPPGDIVDLAKDLKVGNKVRVTYIEDNGLIKVKKLVQEGSDIGEPYVFESYGTARIGGENRMIVRANRDGCSTEFSIPNQAGPDGKPVPEPNLAGKVKEYRRSDIVDLKYDCEDYRFILRDVTPFPMSEGGAVVAVQNKTVGGETCRVLVVSVPTKGTRTLYVPAGKDASPALTATAAGIRPSQAAEFKYFRKGGYCWLTEIAVKTNGS